MTGAMQSSRGVGFADVTVLAADEPGRFGVEISGQWTIMGKPNGGYLLAMLGQAAASAGRHPHVIAASAHYLSSPDPGPAMVETEVLRAGRSASQVRARLTQGDRAYVEALITTSELAADAAPHWDGGVPPVSQVPFEDCPRLVPELPNGRRIAILEHVDVRLEPDSASFTRGQPRGLGELRGWVALPGGEPFDPASLLYAVDSFPPATFDIEFAGWVPTLELTVYVRALPAPGPLRVLYRAQLVEAQRVDQTCYLWDQTGRLVAQATQLAAIRLGGPA